MEHLTNFEIVLVIASTICYLYGVVKLYHRD